MHLDNGKICPDSNEYRYTSTEDNSSLGTTIPVPLEYSPRCSIQRTRRHFIKIFLDVSYYLCVVPYKFVETLDGKYKKQKFFIQQFVCCIVQSLAVMDIVAQLRYFDYREVASNPKMYFEIFISLIHVVVVTSFCYTLWKRDALFCSLVTRVQKCPIISTWYPKKVTYIMLAYMAMNISLALLTPILTFKYGTHSRRVTWVQWYDLHVSRGRFMFFMGDGEEMKYMNEFNSTFAKVERIGSNPLFPNICFAIFSYLAIACQWVVIYSVDIIMNVMALTLWTATSFFTNNLKQNGCKIEDSKQVIARYEHLKTLTNEINCVIGTVTLTYTVDSILYYATHVEGIFTGTDWFTKFVVIASFCSSVNWLHFASNACLQMDQFREWIRQKDNRSHLPTKSVSIMLLIDEISTNTVALSGNGLFTVNYKFVAQALTTLMTYFIIVIQLNQSQKQ